MNKDKKSSELKELVANRKAHFQYEIIETLETGIVLQGTEIKSLRDHGGAIAEAYVTIDNDELWLINSSIAPYRFGAIYNHPERRKRKLLAHKQEIIKLNRGITEKGYTCIPLAMYLKNGRVKVKIALVKGKKLHDKRADIQKRELKRTIDRSMKQTKNTS